MLSKEYDETPHIIKNLTNEVLHRLVRMNRLIAQMTVRKSEEKKEKKTSKQQNVSGRHHYRKKVELPCSYRPAESSPKLRLQGLIKNISLTGINKEVNGKAATNFSHDPGDEFQVYLALPNGKKVHLAARILSNRKPRYAGQLSFGMVFTDMREGAKKELGFLMMP